MESFTTKRKHPVLFSQRPILMKKKINNLEGLTGAECKDYLKIVSDVAPVRAIYSRSEVGIQ